MAHRLARLTGFIVALAIQAAALADEPPTAPQDRPWMNPALTPDARARLVDAALTPEERQSLLHGIFAVPIMGRLPPDAVGSAGYVPGVPRLGVPPLQETDASLGVANPFNVRPGDTATPLPSGLALAATWNPDIAYQGGAMIGQEAWRKGFNVLLGGGANLTRDPRNGRNFEYLGEDPLLAGTLDAAEIRGTEDQHVISTMKHFVLNDQETGRHTLSAKIAEAALRESDLLAFEFALEQGHPGAVMCAYNRINGEYACGNDRMLNRALKGDWRFPGWVMSDWGAVYDWNFARSGLDQESGQQFDKAVYFGEPLAKALAAGAITADRVSDMSIRILRSMFGFGLFDDPPVKTPIDVAGDADIAKREAEEGIVLLANGRFVLPLAHGARHVVVIGGHADAGVLSGGGSAQVIPVGGAALTIPMGGSGPAAMMRKMVFDPSSPLDAIKARLPGADVVFNDGAYPKAAAALARDADVVVVFATQWMIEGEDAPDLSLPNGQDALIEAVAAANPNAIVVLETGGPVTMPWLSKVGAVIEAWYPGAKGGEAIAEILFGDVNPSGRLPITFPDSEAQLPRPALPGMGLPENAAFEVDYNIEGSDVGYRWYAARKLKPLFPFGFGLGYTRFDYANLKIEGGDTVSVSFDVRNLGQRAGMDAPQLYLTEAAGKPRVRLLGWAKLSLEAGATGRVAIQADPRLLASYDEKGHSWRIDKGRYKIAIGHSAEDFALLGEAQIDQKTIKP
jgi:beta-glucosidase